MLEIIIVCNITNYYIVHTNYNVLNNSLLCNTGGNNTRDNIMCSELLSPSEIPSIKMNISSLFISDTSIQFDVLRPSTCDHSAMFFVLIIDKCSMNVISNTSLKYNETFSHQANDISIVIFRLMRQLDIGNCPQSNDAYTFTGMLFYHDIVCTGTHSESCL